MHSNKVLSKRKEKKEKYFIRYINKFNRQKQKLWYLQNRYLKKNKVYNIMMQKYCNNVTYIYNISYVRLRPQDSIELQFISHFRSISTSWEAHCIFKTWFISYLFYTHLNIYIFWGVYKQIKASLTFLIFEKITYKRLT